MGFILPINVWFKNELGKEIYRFLIEKSEGIPRFFDKNYVGLLLNQHASGKAINGNRLWTLLMLELWYQAVHEGKPDVSFSG